MLDGRVEAANLRVNPWLADQWAPPCALVGTFSVTWIDDVYQGLPTATVPVRLVVPAQAQRPAQLDLDLIVSQYASALFADRRLGGVVHDCRPIRTQAVTMLRGSQELPAYECETQIVF